MLDIERFSVQPGDSRNSNIYTMYDIEYGNSWIWRRNQQYHADDVLEFQNGFTLEADTVLEFSLSADSRYEGYLDGEYFGMGPDRSDMNHWAFASYRVKLNAGKHVFSVLCWHLNPGHMPAAQISWEAGGFIFGVKNDNLKDVLNTASGKWRYRVIDGVSFENAVCEERAWSSLISSFVKITGTEYFRENKWEEPEAVIGKMDSTAWGGRHAGWRLYPSPLPEQIRAEHSLSSGTVRAYFQGHDVFGSGKTVSAAHIHAPEIPEWQANIAADKDIVIPPNTDCSLLIDMREYHCGFSFIDVSGGDKDSCVRMSWFESLFGENGKDDRSAIEGKHFDLLLQSDRYCSFDGENRRYRAFWWRAGRYLLVSIRSGAAPFTLRKIGFIESRYPLEQESRIRFPAPELNGIQHVMVRAMQMCCHETYMDCPYYEQLMYVGDTRVECLTGYVMSRGGSLQRRAIDLFDWSRSLWNGVVSEHYPSSIPQLSCTFSLIWPFMLRDFVLWRRFDRKWFRDVRISVRSMLNVMNSYLNADGLPENLPGWSFMDWAQGYGWTNNGLPPPGQNGGVCALYAMLYLNSLKTAMELENIEPDSASPEMLSVWKKYYETVKKAVIQRFFVPEKHRFADDDSRQYFSCHAQALALLADALPDGEKYACYHAMMNDADQAQPTVYFSFYLYEVMTQFGDAALIPQRLGFWHDILRSGAATTWECPEPSRSDCHAWGAHPLYHFLASIAGIRPGSPEFRTVTVKPQLGSMESLQGSLVHPDGDIVFDFRQNDGVISGKIILPGDLTGNLTVNQSVISLKPGENVF